jgi:ribosomal protein S18 acetylase RimI-like enzyme
MSFFILRFFEFEIFRIKISGVFRLIPGGGIRYNKGQQSKRRKQMEFVKATKEDISEISRLYRSAIGSEGCTWSDQYPNQEITESDVKRGDLFCIKNETGNILGAVSVDDDKIVENLACWSKTLQPSAELARLVVKKEQQNQGLAGKLLQGGMDILRERGCRSVHFLVSKTNERALRAYRKIEFQNRGEAELYGESWWCYEKKL